MKYPNIIKREKNLILRQSSLDPEYRVGTRYVSYMAPDAYHHTRALEYIFHDICSPDIGGYGRIWEILRDTAGYSGIQRERDMRDTAG
jgi:hypothetical protein